MSERDTLRQQALDEERAIHWRTAAHEAGHVLLATILFGARPSARIWHDGFGLAFNLGGPAEFDDRRPPAEFRAIARRLALINMAGILAAELLWNPPADLPDVPQPAQTTPDQSAENKTDIENLLRLESDEVKWTGYCAALVHRRQYRSCQRGAATVNGEIFRVYQLGRRLLWKPKHKHEIERIARELFSHGIYQPATPAVTNAGDAGKEFP